MAWILLNEQTYVSCGTIVYCPTFYDLLGGVIRWLGGIGSYKVLDLSLTH
jgi:hypothetical protein